jgi:hypothetical protein
MLAPWKDGIFLQVAIVLGIGSLTVPLPAIAASPPVSQKQGASPRVKAIKAAPTLDDLCSALGITWWQFELPKTCTAIEIGILEEGRFERIERMELSEREAPGFLKVACQDDGFGEYKLVVLTKDTKLQLAKRKKPADFDNTHGTAVKKGEYFELMQFKGTEDKGWRYALVIKILEKSEESKK